MTPSRQRTHTRYDYKRHHILGVYYINGKRIRRALISFEKAGLDDSGNQIKPGPKEAARIDRLEDFLHKKIRDDLRAEAAKTSAAKESAKISKLFQEFIDGKKPTSADGTVYYYLRAGNAFMEIVGDIPVGKIQGRHIEKITATMAEKGLSPYTINNRLRTLKQFFRWCVENEEMARIPPVRQLRPRVRRPDVPGEDEVRAVMQRIQREQASADNQRQKWFFHLHERAAMVWIFTGARRSEACFLPWRHIRLEEQLIQIRDVPGVFKVKEGREKDLLMPPPLHAYLAALRKSYPAEKWYLQAPPHEDEPPTLAYPNPHGLTVAFSRHRRRAAMDLRGEAAELQDKEQATELLKVAVRLETSKVKPTHGFRALAATRLKALGVDLDTIRGMLGHSDIRVTAGYFGEPEELKRAAVEKYGEVYGTQTGALLTQVPKTGRRA